MIKPLPPMIAFQITDKALDFVEIDGPSEFFIEFASEGKLNDECMPVKPRIWRHRMRCLEGEFAVSLHLSASPTLTRRRFTSL
jgi:hypothetical protein